MGVIYFDRNLKKFKEIYRIIVKAKLFKRILGIGSQWEFGREVCGRVGGSPVAARSCPELPGAARSCARSCP